MAADLDDWIDEPIGVEFVAGEEDSEPPQTRYTLEGADERGILIGYIDERDLSSDYRISFFPWHKIERIHLLTEAYSPEFVEWGFSEVQHSPGPMRQVFLCRVSGHISRCT